MRLHPPKHGLAFCLALIAATLFAPAVEAGAKHRKRDRRTPALVASYRTALQIGADNIPADDSQKIRISIFTTPGCAPCERLKQDLKTDPQLRQLVNLADYHDSYALVNIYSTESASQAFRFEMFGVDRFPTVIVQAPPGVGGKPDEGVVVYRQVGYDGAADRLAGNIRGKIKQFIQKIRQTPTPSPVNPTPTPVTINPPPEIYPPVDPAPVPVEPQPTPAPLVPSYPEVLLVTDPQGLGDRLKNAAAEILVDRVKAQFGIDAKFRTVTWQEAEHYPLERNELPAVLITRDGKVLAKIPVHLVQLMTAAAPAPAPKIVEKVVTQTVTEPAPPNTFAALPVSEIVSVIGGSSLLGLVLSYVIVFVLRMIRDRRKAAGENLLLNDEQFEKLIAMINAKAAKNPSPPAGN